MKNFNMRSPLPMGKYFGVNLSCGQCTLYNALWYIVSDALVCNFGFGCDSFTAGYVRKGVNICTRLFCACLPLHS